MRFLWQQEEQDPNEDTDLAHSYITGNKNKCGINGEICTVYMLLGKALSLEL